MGCSNSKTLDVNTDVPDAPKVKQALTQEDGNPQGIRVFNKNTNIGQEQNGFDNRDVHCKRVENHNTGGLINPLRKSFKIGDDVHVRGYVGVVKFVGVTELGEGEWIGIEMQQEMEQGNDGCYEGIQYFPCAAKRGVFARPSVVFPHKDSMEKREQISTISPAGLALLQMRCRRALRAIRRRKLTLRSDLERAVDAHVKSIPKSETVNVTKLSQYLTEPYESLKSKAFAVYRWITINVFFDVEGYFETAAKKGTDAESVLRKRVTTSEGYANLFQELCRSSNVPARKVRGFAKGYGYQMRQKIPEPNHSWNVIRVNGGKWFICDPTWGAGSIGEDMMFHRDPNVHQFMIPPSIAITNRFPAEEKWQFLDAPITKEAFERLAVPLGPLRMMNVALCSHKESMYTASDSEKIEMTFYATDSAILKGVLKNSVSGRERPTTRNMVRVEPARENNKVKLTAQFPSAGEFVLEVMVLVDSKWEHGVRYYIYSTAGVGEERGGFPTVSLNFKSLGFQLHSPLRNIETRDGKCSVTLTCGKKRFGMLEGRLIKTSGEQTGKVEDHNLCCSEKTEDGFRLKVHLPSRGEYKLSIYAKYYDPSIPEEYLCTYFVTAYKGAGLVPGFPIIAERLRAWGLTLSSHSENILAENGQTSITVQNPKGVLLSAHLKLDEKDLHGMCAVENMENESVIQVHAPESGFFTLNIFGRKTVDAKSEFLCSYTIRALKGVSNNPGFPQISELFKTWQIELVDQHENILSECGRASLKLKTPGSILVQATLQQGEDNLPHELCFTEREGHVSKISVHLPVAGLYKLNIFGRDGPSAKGQFLSSFSVLATSGFGENPGFPRVSDEFREWGLRLESHRQNITVYDGSVAITFINPNAIKLIVRLINAENEETQEKSCLSKERCDERDVIYCQLPGKGKYTLDVLGKNSSNSKKKVLLCSYSIFY
ncbi:uncharacterized protein LOC111329907 [Stylophora pistillata]|uniref:uncharacterized protein LOC111329907 n=1 Tax=Stylophora pistillata TaxID=50429 RepID=UPI000C04F5E1|nr:uncharacterized protein LOC111329907 [Stylophora pistillata]